MGMSDWLKKANENVAEEARKKKEFADQKIAEEAEAKRQANWQKKVKQEMRKIFEVFLTHRIIRWQENF